MKKKQFICKKQLFLKNLTLNKTDRAPLVIFSLCQLYFIMHRRQIGCRQIGRRHMDRRQIDRRQMYHRQMYHRQKNQRQIIPLGKTSSSKMPRQNQSLVRNA